MRIQTESTEEVFRDLFATIPPYALSTERNGEALPLRFWWGSQKELNRVIVHKKVNGESAYPLLWYILPNVETEIGIEAQGNSFSGVYRFVLAMNTQYDWFNDQRWEATFKKYLFPYYSLIKQALKKGGVVNLRPVDGNRNYFRVTKLPNYGNPTTHEGKEEAKQVDFWDALLFEIDAEITGGCIASIKYDTNFNL